MEPASTEPPSRSDNAALGILAGLGLGLAVAVACVFLFAYLLPSHGLVIAIPFLLPPVSVVVVAGNARRNKRPKFAAGLFIAAAVVALLEGTCAYQWFR